jgi:hypothetical protein
MICCTRAPLTGARFLSIILVVVVVVVVVANARAV